MIGLSFSKSDNGCPIPPTKQHFNYPMLLVVVADSEQLTCSTEYDYLGHCERWMSDGGE